ncbi:MAG: oligoendopeptidase F, partial [Clostridiales Family XIII bacterium]|nr:oligoendopeptidase F [Clostridiales Family XIII bacterium]
MSKKRREIDKKYKWDIGVMYPDETVWENDYARAEKAALAFGKYTGTLGTDGKVLLKAFREMDSIWQITEKVYVYARMKRDEDNAVSKYQTLADRSQTLIARVSAALSFFTPEFLAIPKKKLETFRKDVKGLSGYDYVMDSLLRRKPHVLSDKEENLLAQFGEILGSTGEIFTMLNDADIRFGAVQNEKGKKVEVTHGNYITFMESRDRQVRKAAYGAMYDAYEKQKNTLAATYGYNTKTDVMVARVRGYGSALEHSLAGDNVPVSVYDNLIETVNKNLDVLHGYMDVRRKVLDVSKLHMYDIYVPLFTLTNDHVKFEDAAAMMQEALKPLGEAYGAKMAAGVKAGWIDVFENMGKTSGAYSFGSYDSMPYILMNYSGKLKDVFTLVHEMGHSMHSLYTREKQPFRYGSHSIFTAEVASTVNESLLIRYLLETRPAKREQKYLINLYIEEFRTTLFRQTMFAEFEKFTHAAVEGGAVLTADFLSDAYGKLNEKYFGKHVITDDSIRMEWSRIPHFYRAFYVYKYATGYSAATAIADQIVNDREKSVKGYLEFLKSGDSADPIDLLKIAGVDMSRPEPI